MDIWVGGEYDYGSSQWYLISSGTPITNFPPPQQSYITYLNATSGEYYNVTVDPAIDENMCPSSYLDMRGLVLQIRFDYNFSTLQCVPWDYSSACYALCTNGTTSSSNTTILNQITTTTLPLPNLSTNNAWSGLTQLVSSTCSLTLFEARNQCLAQNLTLAYLSTQNDFYNVVQLFQPTVNK